MKLRDAVDKVRSKNAGPFWLTIDIFCGDADRFSRATRVHTTAFAEALGVETQLIRRFDMPELNVIKLSLPRPTVQGSAADRDMHGASFAVLIAEMEI